MRRRELLQAVGACALAGTASAHPAHAGRGTAPATTAGGAGDGTAFAPLASLPVPGAAEAVVGPDGTTVYMAVVDGFAVVDLSRPADPRLLAERRELLADVDDGPLRDVREVAVDGDRLLAMGPAHPNERVVEAAVLFDVADPATPRQLAVHRTDHPIHNGALLAGRAYLTANDGRTNPVEIVAMEEDGDGAGEPGGGPRVLGRWSIVDEDEAWSDVPAGIRPIHDVIVQEEVAYCSYWDAGTWIVDVSDPGAPVALGRVGGRSAGELASIADAGMEGAELPGNHHSAAIDGSGTLLAVGHEAWDADGDGSGGPGGIELVDVSTPASPERLATIEAPPTSDASRGGVWTTAHNFELRDGVLYAAWYQGGVTVHDVSDPEAPREVAAWRDSEATRFWTAQRSAGAVVASSMGTETGPAGLYTFPVPDTEATARVSPTPTESGPTSPGSRGSSVSDSVTQTERRVTASPGMAGFDAAAAVLGGGLAWLLARRRRA